MTTMTQYEMSFRPARPSVTLTRRGRVVVLLAVLSVVLVVFGLGRHSAGAADGSAPSAPVTTTVGTGESLWSVSSRLWPRADPRDGVAALAKANHLHAGAPLAVGTVLQVP